jgi:hypothetical protein
MRWFGHAPDPPYGVGTAWHFSGMLGHTHIFVAEPPLRPPWPLMAVSGET